MFFGNVITFLAACYACLTFDIFADPPSGAGSTPVGSSGNTASAMPAADNANEIGKYKPLVL